MTQKLRWIENKILADSTTMARRCRQWQALDKKIVFTNGCFDILHRGHLVLLAKAADLGNVLVVGLNTDSSVKRLKGPTRPVNHQDDRAFQLASLLCVDAVCLFDEDTPKELIEKVRPDVLVKGGDYQPEQIVGADFVKSYGGTVATINFEEGYSTTALIGKIKFL